jgi:hypothetical protein
MTYDFWFKHSGANVWQWFHGGPTSAVWTADSTWTIPGSTPGSLYWATGVTHTPAYDEVVWSNANLRSDTNWNHIALVKYGSLHMMFVNGVKQTRTVDIGVQVPAFNAVDFFVGRSASDPGDGCTAYMDEVRLSVGKARWTENFTPPVAPYFYNG